MKKHCSVLWFCARTKIYKVLAILAAMAAVSIAGFRALGFLDAPMLGGNHGDWFLGGICVIGYTLCILSCVEIPSTKSKSSYTVQRLQISERAVLLWDMLVCVLIFLSFYAVQLLILCTVGQMYAAAPGYVQGEQGVLMDFYRSAILHGMLPLSEQGLWWRNLLYMAATGAECACTSVNLRYNPKSLSASFLVAAAVMLQFPKGLGEETYVFPVILAGAACVSCVRTLWRAHNGKRRQNHEAEAQ